MLSGQAKALLKDIDALRSFVLLSVLATLPPSGILFMSVYGSSTLYPAGWFKFLMISFSIPLPCFIFFLYTSWHYYVITIPKYSDETRADNKKDIEYYTIVSFCTSGVLTISGFFITTSVGYLFRLPMYDGILSLIVFSSVGMVFLFYVWFEMYIPERFRVSKILMDLSKDHI